MFKNKSLQKAEVSIRLRKRIQKHTVNFFLKTEVGKTGAFHPSLQFHKKKKKKKKKEVEEDSKHWNNQNRWILGSHKTGCFCAALQIYHTWTLAILSRWWGKDSKIKTVNNAFLSTFSQLPANWSLDILWSWDYIITFNCHWGYH